MKIYTALGFSALVAVLCSFSACTTTHVVKTKSTNSAISQINLLAVGYSRPDLPYVDQDEFRYQGQTLNCLSAQQLWEDELKRHSEIRECLNELEHAKALYFYVPENKPFLELDFKDEFAPPCLKEVLPKIPLPREVYFLADQSSSDFHREAQGCYSSSFGIQTNQTLKTRNLWMKKRISLPISPERKLKNEKDLMTWLMVTTFSVLKSDEQSQGVLWGAPVPELICRSCFKNDANFEDKFTGKMKPVFWP